MRVTILGVIILLVMFMGISYGAFQENLSQKPILEGKFDNNKKWSDTSTVTAKKDGLIAIKLDGDTATSQIALVDPKQRVIGIYGIDRSTGAIKLKSVRKVEWDLQLDEFNGSQPTPREIRSAVKKK